MRYLVWLLLILLLVFRYSQTRPIYKNGDNVRITAPVLSDPIRYSYSQYINLHGLRIYLPLFPEIFYGSKIAVEGIVEDRKITDAKLISVEEDYTLLSNFRNSIIKFYKSTLPEPMGGLMAGVVIGAAGAIPTDFYDKTKLTGLTHVVVASGTNVTFVFSFLLGLFTILFKRKIAILFCILGIILYLFISGFDAPLVRAAIMASILIFAQESGRIVKSWNILLYAAGLMLIYNPAWAQDIGFILSFVSTSSIMLFQFKIYKKIDLKYLPNFVKQDFSTTLAAQIGVSPILFVTFGQFNILSPLINLMVLWTIPFIMILGAVGGVLGIMFPLFGKILIWLAYPLLWWFVQTVELFA